MSVVKECEPNTSRYSMVVIPLALSSFANANAWDLPLPPRHDGVADAKRLVARELPDSKRRKL